MKFQYVGNGVEDPEATVFYGYKFRLKGPFIDVTNEAALVKIQTNPTFRVKDEIEKPKKAKK